MYDSATFGEMEVTFLQRGENYPDLFDQFGLNGATKRARHLARLKGLTPSSIKTVYLDRTHAHH